MATYQIPSLEVAVRALKVDLGIQVPLLVPFQTILQLGGKGTVLTRIEIKGLDVFVK
jgi:hypothetical protein